MDNVYQWMWDRHGARYRWANVILMTLEFAPSFTLSGLLLLRFEGSDRYLPIAGVCVVASALGALLSMQTHASEWRLIEAWTSDGPIDGSDAIETTYRLGRRLKARVPLIGALAWGVMGALAAAVAGASGSRLGQWAVVSAVTGIAVNTHGMHAATEGIMRPVRAAITGDAVVGDSLPRARPSFATWSGVTLMSAFGVATLAGVLFGVTVDRASQDPFVAVAIALGMVVFVAVPISLIVGFSPMLRPLRDLADGTERVTAGDYTQRLPAVQDDDLGVLTASFNRMQAGLAQRERLHAAFGSYVDPALAARLLEQGDDIFTGERIDVTVMFVDIRDFTPFAEANTAEDTVTHLNALFEIVVPAVLDAGGHVNKYLGDGAMAVFGAPITMTNHADAAIAAARTIQRLVDERFNGATRIGIGINTGTVIAGTIGGGGKLEFTLIGDTVNVAARIEALTKTTGDTILLTQHTLDALTAPDGLIDRGTHELKGKTAQLRVHALEPPVAMS